MAELDIQCNFILLCHQLCLIPIEVLYYNVTDNTFTNKEEFWASARAAPLEIKISYSAESCMASWLGIFTSKFI